MAAHVGARVSDDLQNRLELMKDLKGLNTVSDLVRHYVEEGLERDSADIEAKVEERLAAERDRMQALVASFKAPPGPDSEDDDADTVAPF